MRRISIQTLIGNGLCIKPVEFDSVDELKQQLAEQGLGRFGRYARCAATGDGRVEGSMGAVADLSESDVDWVGSAPEYERRCLTCAEK